MSTPTIENIIVVMLENRSYDNMLGALYLNSNPAPGLKEVKKEIRPKLRRRRSLISAQGWSAATTLGME